VQLLANWPGKTPVIKLGGDGIRLEIQGVRVEKPEEILSIIQLGEAILEARPS
jgi:hypothetical protein